MKRRTALATLAALAASPAHRVLADDAAGLDLARRLVVPGTGLDLASYFTGALERTVPLRRTEAGAPASPLADGESLAASFRYRHQGEQLSPADYLARQPVTGLLVARGGKVLAEAYAKPWGRETRFLSASMCKSIVGLLAGAALADGSLASLDDPAAKYVPALRACAYGEVPVRHLLQMSSGVRFAERYDGTDDLRDLIAGTIGHRTRGGAEVLLPYRESRARPGALFHYASADTQALALVLRAAVGTSLAEYASEKLWRPLGAESHGSFLVDAAGCEAAYAFFHARLRDFARIGVMLAQDGSMDGRQVISERWVREATSVAGAHTQPFIASAFFGYGHQFWVFPGSRRQFAMRGVRGQVVFVDPARHVVLAQTALWGSAGDRAAQAELLALWDALTAS